MLLFSQSAFSASQWCTGKVTDLWVDSNGDLLIRSEWRDDHTKLCNVANAWEGITTETCKSWMSILQTAMASRRNATVFYSDAPACAELPTYRSAPKPGYVMLRNN